MNKKLDSFDKHLRRRLYIDYINSPTWKLKRAVILNENSKCEACGEKRYLQLHHKHYNTLGSETAEDFIILCGRCHRATHGRPLPRKKISKREERQATAERKKARRAKKARRRLRRLHTYTREDAFEPYKRPAVLSKRKVDYTNSYYKL